jgi:putative pyruvate formate lyase activating enzyme
MRCAYCQNYPISQMGYGNDIGVKDLTAMMVYLQNRGAHNINLVTATHFLPQVVEAIADARTQGLNIPIVSNTSGYERAETIRKLEGFVQVYMVDMRYSRGESSARYSEARDYPEHNRRAIVEMVNRTGPLVCRDGVAVHGVIIRHLLLPSLLGETREILRFISRDLPVRVPVSLMTQYFPTNRAAYYPEIDRKIAHEEYEEGLSLLDEFRIDEGWVQDPAQSTHPVT